MVVGTGAGGGTTFEFASSLSEGEWALPAKTDSLLKPGLGNEKSSEAVVSPGAGASRSEACAQAEAREKNTPVTITKIEKWVLFISFYLAVFYHAPR